MACSDSFLLVLFLKEGGIKEYHMRLSNTRYHERRMQLGVKRQNKHCGSAAKKLLRQNWAAAPVENDTNSDTGATETKTDRYRVWHVFDQACAHLFSGEVIFVRKLAAFHDRIIRWRAP